jgi:hypothetical protein
LGICNLRSNGLVDLLPVFLLLIRRLRELGEGDALDVRRDSLMAASVLAPHFILIIIAVGPCDELSGC